MSDGLRISRSEWQELKQEAERAIRTSQCRDENGNTRLLDKHRHDAAQRRLDQLDAMETEGMVDEAQG